MGVFKGLVKTAKFVGVTMPLAIGGWTLNKKLLQLNRDSWVRAVNPACPECEHGVLVCSPDEAPLPQQSSSENGSAPRYPWSCIQCGFALLEERNTKRVREIVRVRWEQRARSRFSDLDFQERLKIADKHRFSSRVFFAASTCTFLSFLYLLMTGSSFILALNWASFALMFWVFGMKRSYRAWQISYGHLFEEGAFNRWFKHEKWLI